MDLPFTRFYETWRVGKAIHGTEWDRDWDGKLLFPCRPRKKTDDVKLVWSLVVSVFGHRPGLRSSGRHETFVDFWAETSRWIL